MGRARTWLAFGLLLGGCGADPVGASTTGGSGGAEAASGGGAGTPTSSGGEGGGQPTTVGNTSATSVGGQGSAGSGGEGTGDGGGGSGGGGGGGGGEPPPDIDTIPWETGDEVGFGVARKDTQNPLGDSVFVGYAGYGIGAEAARAWTTALYRASLGDRGVRHVYAVQGPADVGYAGLEIGNSRIAAALGAQVSADTRFILVAAHSSGSYVAHELLGQLAGGLDPDGVTEGQVVYFNLDGGLSGLSGPIVDRLRRAYFVGALDSGTGTASPNRGTMQAGGSLYEAAGGYWELDATSAGCAVGAPWCIHMTPITTRPHESGISELDYLDFEDRPVAMGYIEAKAAEAGLD